MREKINLKSRISKKIFFGMIASLLIFFAPTTFAQSERDEVKI